MADTKITALTAISTNPVNPATFPIPMVDLLDTSMAASGTTKKVTVNQILGSGGTATLASATITGDLTVDTSTLKVDSTNNRVGIVQATPLYPLHLVGEFGLEEASVGNGTKLRLIGDATKYNFRLGKQLTATNTFEITPSTAVGGTTFSNPVYTVSYDGIHTFLDGAGGTRMTLNSTGLGVGAVPSAYKLHVAGTGYFSSILTLGGASRISAEGSNALNLNTNSVDRLTIDSSGNVGIGVTPSAWRTTQRALQIGAVGSLFSSTASTGSTCIGRNVYESTAGDYTYIANDEATLYEQTATGTHAWYNAVAGTGTISFGSPKMTLDASGNLILLSSATPATLATNGQLTVNATSNTNLRFSYRGSDGTTRVANITLA